MSTRALSLMSAALCLLAVASAHAEKMEVWHGWMNLTPCQKLEWRNDGIFGTPSPTYVDGPQELHAWIYADVTTSVSDLQSKVLDAGKSCAVQGAAAAGVTALVTNGPGAWEAFTSTFWSCMQRDPISQYVANVSYKTDSFCKW